MYAGEQWGGGTQADGQAAPYMVQMVGMPMGYGAQAMDPRMMMSGQAMGGYFMPQQAQQQRADESSAAAAASASIESASGSMTGFKYMSDNIVMAAGQYREVRPMVAPALLAGGSRRFFAEPADLPRGLQLDPSTGIIWGTPLPTKEDQSGANDYQYYTVYVTGQGVKASTHIGIKVVHFQPNNFKITHVSQLERNKYMVLIDTRGAGESQDR